MFTGALGAALLAREAVERGEAPAGGVSLAAGGAVSVAVGVALAPDAGSGLPASLTPPRARPRAPGQGRPARSPAWRAAWRASVPRRARSSTSAPTGRE